MKRKAKVTIHLNGVVPVTFKDATVPMQAGQRYFKGTMKQIKLAKPERGKPGIYNPTYSHSVN